MVNFDSRDHVLVILKPLNLYNQIVNLTGCNV